MAERTLIIIKPDGIQRRLAGEVIGRFEKKGLKLVAARFTQISEDLAARLYAVHKGKPFYKGLVKYLCSAPVMGCVVNGPGEAADADLAICAAKNAAYIYRNGKRISRVPENKIIPEVLKLLKAL